MKIIHSILFFVILLGTFSCSDEDRGCPHKFSPEERNYFNYNIGQKIKFVSAQCDDTLLIEISSRYLSEGPTGQTPEADRGKCSSYLEVAGSVNNSDTINCFKIEEYISFSFHRLTGDPDKVTVSLGDSDWNTVPAGVGIQTMSIHGRVYPNVLRVDSYKTIDHSFKSVYLSLQYGLLRIDYNNGSQVISYEKIE